MALEIEPEPPEAFLLIRPVAMKTSIREDRSNIAIKLQPFLPPGKGYAKTEKNKGDEKLHEHYHNEIKIKGFATPREATEQVSARERETHHFFKSLSNPSTVFSHLSASCLTFPCFELAKSFRSVRSSPKSYNSQPLPFFETIFQSPER